MPPDTKTKIRPQQSCLKCRERKVKCDRSIPCHACIIRGLDAECTYTASAEDRAHISQADIIEQLRREVAQLRGRLNQPREPARPTQKSWRAHPYAPARKEFKEREGSWSGSSPSSTTMTGSANVTSPDSTGSEIGAGSVSSRSVSSRSASVSAPATSSSTATAPATVSAPYLFAREDGPSQELDLGQTHYLGFGDVNQGPVHGLPAPPESLPFYPHINYTTPVPTQYDHISTENQGWEGYEGMGPMPVQMPAPYPSQYSSIDSFANANANANTYADASLTASGDTTSHASPSSDSLSPTIMNSIPSSWKGEGKKAVLQALLETIGSCDEHQVSRVIHVVRTSPTPEDAVSGICQVLGLGTGW
ncbi:unnamed protein product [Penicillium olsonii]|uniref:Zn(2)-C6 fungal-type domain-containing protein n=1 Tax=Penicillium olsonii TaxID=99116 RepID=A0A9W4MQM9_PENOL|nr:unnamed protein product [Penicillium olsonii]CAG7931189.1 unnamed protein product [Penicillium olsonii]CAG8010599.1 unnamed protein product [Penicillium olsonii]